MGYWSPINSKDDYNLFLEADMRWRGLQKWSTLSRFTSVILAWQRLLRKAEYYRNCKSSGIWGPYNRYLWHKLQLSSIKLGFNIPLNVFGPGLNIPHWGTIVVHPNAKVGANCELHNDTHIALKTWDSDKAPKIGDNVFIGAGARILGDIELADWVAVGANAVVTKSLTEPHTTIAGIPARKIYDRGTEDFFYNEGKSLFSWLEKV
ncbi:MAG: serine O-acetyltransferase [Halobacteriota archaeon]